MLVSHCLFPGEMETKQNWHYKTCFLSFSQFLQFLFIVKKITCCLQWLAGTYIHNTYIVIKVTRGIELGGKVELNTQDPQYNGSLRSLELKICLYLLFEDFTISINSNLLLLAE